MSAGGDVNATKTHVADLRATGTAHAQTAPTIASAAGTPVPTEFPIGKAHPWVPLHYQATVYAIDRTLPPADGRTVLAIDAEECVQDSAGADVAANAQASDFQLALTDGSDLPPSGPAHDQPFVTKALTKGVCERGWITFELPAGATAEHVAFNGTVKSSAFTARVTGWWDAKSSS
jgi:hypothetical protein